MLDSAVRFDPAEDPISRDRSRSAAAMAELFAPLDRLLGCGGDPRLRLNPATGATVAEISRNEGKPEAALAKIVDGRMNGWFKDRVLLDQSYVRDEKQTITGMLGSSRIVAFAQVVIGA